MIYQNNSESAYQAVVGLAGHVDHGKTALIEALTGMMTARPHEQALGMTQDLGFAHFADDAGNTIGVVDVPGHERYLRNMVAGVWHLNALILVIAADEGWMPMTTSHLQVAHAMGISNIIVCINKSDKVSSEELAEVEEQALEHVMDMSGLVPELVSVSALSGDNIPELRELIIETLTQDLCVPCVDSDQPKIEAEPLLYVDRAFVVNGIGTVVTGTLAQGILSIGDKVRCYPSGLLGTVRSLQAYHRQLESVSGTCRVAVNIKGLTRKEVERGHLVTGREQKIAQCEQCLVRLNPSEDEPSAKRQREVEVAIGTWHGFAKLCYIPNTNLARLIFKKPVSLQFAQRLAMIQKGGSRLLHGAQVVWTDFIPSYQKRRIYTALNELPESLTAEALPQLLLSLQGYFDVEQIAGDSDCQGVTLGPYLFESDWLARAQENILQRLDKGLSLSSVELSDQLEIEEPVLNVIMQELKQRQIVHLSYGKWRHGEGDNEDELPTEALTLLQQTRDCGKAGLELSKIKLAPGSKKWLRQLCHQKYITALDESIYYDMGIYREMIQAVVADHQSQDRISMGDIKDRTGLSRKYAIPLANRMEKDGWVRRDGDERIILKSWEEVSS
ncbi:selenocysteine-specific translation elongation factor [Dongshaea marina]|uniref:selenocysteine-specific translation elongation factor n=1 Tax=Dongshaea marina TaxID=2047966 RepID=UPI000D3E5880|nr:selenocysteine-specific translation elongation factor [Dongshaea marina]